MCIIKAECFIKPGIPWLLNGKKEKGNLQRCKIHKAWNPQQLNTKNIPRLQVPSLAFSTQESGGIQQCLCTGKVAAQIGREGTISHNIQKSTPGRHKVGMAVYHLGFIEHPEDTL